LLYFVTAVLGALVAPGISGLGGALHDAAAMATSIQAHETSVRLAWALGLVSTALYTALIALFYQLFWPVSRTLMTVAAFLGLVGCALTAFGSLFLMAPVVILKGSPSLSVFDAQQTQALALLFFNLNVELNSIALVFFGFFQLALGYLIFRSTFLPRVLGVLIALAGVGWLTVLWPPLESALLRPIEVLGFVAEVALMLWLLVMGVDAQRWQELAGEQKS
jgi:hypothetical protein